jgi:ATP-dependent RNA helicase RhlE
MNFSDFPLHETLLANIGGMGFTSPTQIQEQIIPMALEGKDVSGLSRTGTGKTAAFLIPAIHRLSTLPEDRIVLCLAPTRELAQQIETEAQKLSKGMNMGTAVIVGGVSYDHQIRAIREGARIITGTPGRVMDLFKEKHLDLARVELLVFDEADRMFDMGFIKDMHYILRNVNPKRQILLFSATMNYTVLNLIYEYDANPIEINVSRDQMTADKIQQLLFHVSDNEKPKSLLAVCKRYLVQDGVMIVFANYKEKVIWIADFLTANGIPARGLSSLLSQDQRNKIIQGYREGKFRALVATDVASRGLDIEDIALVVNYHLPEDSATYVHRIGRTARAGKDGIAISIAGAEDAYNQLRVEEFLGAKIPVDWLNDEDFPKEVKMPSRRHRGDHHEEKSPQSEGRDDMSDNTQQPPRDQPARREPRRDNRQDGRRDHRRDGGRRDNRRDGRRDYNRDREQPQEVAPAEMPSPLTGNPIIYDMRTGAPKNRTKDEIRVLLDRLAVQASQEKGRPAILSRLGSKVTSLFGSRK